MKKENNEMFAEYDLSRQKGVRGKYAKADKKGHSVKIYDGDRLVSDDYFAVIEPDVRAYFSNSNTINKALRKLISIIPKEPQAARK
jgi:hypothetical protein